MNLMDTNKEGITMSRESKNKEPNNATPETQQKGVIENVKGKSNKDQNGKESNKAKPKPPREKSSNGEKQKTKPSKKDAVLVGTTSALTNSTGGKPLQGTVEDNARRAFYDSLVEIVKKETSNERESFNRIAIALANIELNELYDLEDCTDVYQMAKKVFGMQKSTANQYLNVVKSLGVIEDGKYIELDTEWNGYNHSQLIELKDLTPEQIQAEGITKDTSVRKMREARHKYYGKKQYNRSGSDSNNSNSNPKENQSSSEVIELLPLTIANDNLLSAENNPLLEELKRVLSDQNNANKSFSITLTFANDDVTSNTLPLN